MQDKVITKEISSEANERVKKMRLEDEPEDEEALSQKRNRSGEENL